METIRMSSSGINSQDTVCIVKSFASIDFCGSVIWCNLYLLLDLRLLVGWMNKWSKLRLLLDYLIRLYIWNIHWMLHILLLGVWYKIWLLPLLNLNLVNLLYWYWIEKLWYFLLLNCIYFKWIRIFEILPSHYIYYIYYILLLVLRLMLMFRPINRLTHFYYIPIKSFNYIYVFRAWIKLLLILNLMNDFPLLILYDLLIIYLTLNSRHFLYENLLPIFFSLF